MFYTCAEGRRGMEGRGEGERGGGGSGNVFSAAKSYCFMSPQACKKYVE
jgi:hypothetical protein